jgi:hypothetical protein
MHTSNYFPLGLSDADAMEREGASLRQVIPPCFLPLTEKFLGLFPFWVVTLHRGLCKVSYLRDSFMNPVEAQPPKIVVMPLLFVSVL